MPVTTFGGFGNILTSKMSDLYLREGVVLLLNFVDVVGTGTVAKLAVQILDLVADSHRLSVTLNDLKSDKRVRKLS